MFSVRIVARPDARMVEVPLEIEAELPRDFEGAALLSSSGLPRKIRIKAQRDLLKLSTAYRADQLLADLVKAALRASPVDVEKVQVAARNFVKSVRERRPDGATLTVESNGRGKIEVSESLPAAAVPAARSTPPDGSRATPAGTPADRVAALERRLEQLEGRVAPAVDGGDRLSSLEKRIAALEARPHAPGVGEPPRGVLKGRGTAIEAFADGLRSELRDRVAAQRAKAEETASRCDKAAALAMEAERVLGAPQEGVSQQLRATSTQAAARAQALERVHAEVDLYAVSDLPVAAGLVARLADGPQIPDPAGVLERQARSIVRAARGENPERRTWLVRAAALCGWELIDPAPGEPLSPELHVAVDTGGDRIARVAAPGLRRKDSSILCRARVEVSPEARAAEPPETPVDAEEVELLAEEDVELAPPRRMDDTPPPIDQPTPPHGLPVGETTGKIEPERTQRLAGQPERTRRLAVPPAADGAQQAVAAADAKLAAAPAEPKPPEARVPAAPAPAVERPAPAPAMERPAPAPAVERPAPAAAATAVERRAPTAQPERPAPERVPGPPLVLGGGETPPSARANVARRTAPARPAEPLTDLDRDVAAAARQVHEPEGADDLELVDEEVAGDDLALATEVAAAVETETDDDAEWAQLARGPSAFPGEGKPRPPPDEDGGPDEPQD